MPPLPYNPRLKEYARELRNRSTLAEVLLWNHLKRGKRHGIDFHRQKPILEWIADFYSAELKLVIEIDGDSHRVRARSDAAKEAAFRGLGLTVLRFGDTQVKQDAEAVAECIDRWIEENRMALSKEAEHTPPFGHPSQEGTSASGKAGRGASVRVRSAKSDAPTADFKENLISNRTPDRGDS